MVEYRVAAIGVKIIPKVQLQREILEDMNDLQWSKGFNLLRSVRSGP
jgi:hypothetical protein